MRNKTYTLLIPVLGGMILASCIQKKASVNGYVNNSVPGLHTNYPASEENLSEAMRRNNTYDSEYPMENELYTTFKYTELKGFDYNGGDGTISRRDPSKIIFENGKYYVWYTHRHTVCPPIGSKNAAQCDDKTPSTDWDLAEIWYATSSDGFTWEEQGVAVPRPPKPQIGHRSVSTPDILKYNGKYYLYYQSFNEPSGLRGDLCPVSMSYSDSPDGPWTPCGKAVVETGKKGEWDEHIIHDPFPLVHDSKIYMYYKSGFNHRDAGGLAISDSPDGPFEKHPLNPVLNSGHEVSLFPFREGVAAMVIKAGNEHNTIQYAADWVNFKIASFVNLMPNAPAGFIPDAFTDSGNGRGILWGLCHFTGMGEKRDYSRLDRFDCDLSLDVDDRQMKEQVIYFPRSLYFQHGLTTKQLKRISEDNKKISSTLK